MSSAALRFFLCVIATAGCAGPLPPTTTAPTPVQPEEPARPAPQPTVDAPKPEPQPEPSSDPSPQAFTAEQLIGDWHQDFDQRGLVYVPTSVDLPPRAVRPRITLQPAGRLKLVTLSVNDGRTAVDGTWALQDGGILVLRYQAGKRRIARHLEVRSVTPSRLELRGLDR